MRGIVLRAWRLVLCALAVLSVSVLLLLAVGPHVLGYRTLVMRTGSMRPVIDPGDLVVIRREPVDHLAAGQLLTFTAPVPERPVITHRVVHVDRRGPRPVVTTQGDANPGPDPWRAEITDTSVWHPILVVRGVGRVVGLLHQPWVHVVSSWLLPLALLLDLLLALWWRPAGGSPPGGADDELAPEDGPEAIAAEVAA